MKKGKTAKIHGFNQAKVTYGTVDSTNLKSLYLNIQSWVEPKVDCDNWNRIVNNLNRTIKHVIHDNLNKSFFEEKFIVDLDLRSSGIYLGKKSFMNLEINFYLKENNLEFKTIKVKDELKAILKKIFQDALMENEYFQFSLTKEKKPNH